MTQDYTSCFAADPKCHPVALLSPGDGNSVTQPPWLQWVGLGGDEHCMNGGGLFSDPLFSDPLYELEIWGQQMAPLSYTLPLESFNPLCQYRVGHFYFRN